MPVFGYGDLRLYLLKLLDGAPRYGYELIRLLEERFLGAYTPSAGTIYPRLAALEEEGLVEHTEEEGRKVYRLTDEGRQELADREGDMDDLEERVGKWAGDLAKGVLDDLKVSLEGLSRDLRDVLVDTGFDGRDAVREAVRFARDAGRAGRHGGRGERRGSRPRRDDLEDASPVRADLRAFVADVSGAVAQRPPDRERLRRIQEVLLDARHAIASIVEEGPEVVADADVEVLDGPAH